MHEYGHGYEIQGKESCFCEEKETCEECVAAPEIIRALRKLAEVSVT